VHIAEKQKYFISILICSRDRRRELERLVAKLQNMDSAYNYEIVVVEETDQPVPLKDVIYVPHPVANRGIPYARNLALSHAKGDIIVFLDDDCIIHDRWLDNLLAPFQDKTVVGVQGGVSVPEGSRAIGWAESILGFPGGGIRRVLEAKGRVQETREISTLNCAYRRWAIERVGGFEKRLRLTGEDYVLAKQVCTLGRCLFVPNAMVSHEARSSLKKIWQWFVRRGRAEVDVISTKAQGDLTLWTLARGSIILKCCALVFLGIVSRFLVTLLLAGALLFAMLQYMRYFKAWNRSPAPFLAFLLLPFVKILMDVAVDWGRIRGLVLD